MHGRVGRDHLEFDADRPQMFYRASPAHTAGEISQKMLASTLRDLEENGLVSRTVTPVAPPQVEYALTDLGREFLCPIRGLAEWVLENAPRMDAARAAYAERGSAQT
jgi:DNA-binding HxlR family transcriptional regulator